MTPEIAAGSPAHRHLLEPGARCELEDGHDGPHRAGAHLTWHAPPLVVRQAQAEIGLHSDFGRWIAGELSDDEYLDSLARRVDEAASW